MAAYKPIRIGDSVPLQQINPSTETIDGKIQVTQTGVVLGRSSAGAGAHEEILFADLPGGGGASYTEITYADMATALSGGTLTPGGWYLITDATGTDLGFLTYAVKENEISPAGVGGFTLNSVDEWDICEYDFAGNQLIYREDKRGNVVRGAIGVAQFPWGYDNVTGNFVLNGVINLTINAAATYTNNTVYPGATISDITVGDASTIENNILENGAQLTGITAGANCSISRNKIGQGATLGGTTTMGDGSLIVDNLLFNNAIVSDITAGANCEISNNKITGYVAFINMLDGSFLIYNTVGTDSSILYSEIGGNGAAIQSVEMSTSGSIYNVVLGSTSRIFYATMQPGSQIGDVTGTLDTYFGLGTLVDYNILESGSKIYNITSGENCSISRNKIGQGATLGGGTTMGDGAAFNDLDIRANKQISNKALDAAVTFSDKIVQLTTDAAETYSANVEGNRVQPGYSDIPGTLDITGLTTLDCTAAWAQYRGIFNMTSTNATEAIDTITNPPTLFPFTLRPAAGLVLTITGTAYAGIGAGQIALKAASYALDGDKGEYIVLEIDPLGTGALIEKAVINGLI